MKRRLNIKRLFILLILFISIGFAYLSTNLNINGILNSKGNTWNIYLDNIQVTEGSVALSQNDIYPVISSDKLTINYSVTLSFPGDYYEFTFDAVNDGTLDAAIDIYEQTSLSVAQSRYLIFNITYEDGSEIYYNDYLDRNTSKTYKARIEYKRDINEEYMPDSDQNIELSFSCTYKKAEKHNFSEIQYGYYVNDKIASLSGNRSNVTAIERANTLAIEPTENNIISERNSKYPIYIWYDNGTVYWYCEGQDVRLVDGYAMFKNLNNLTDISSISEWNTEGIYSLQSFFEGCSSLSDFSPIEDWEVSSLQYSNDMFKNCTSMINVDFLLEWNVKELSNADGMFQGCSSLQNVNGVTNWNTYSLNNLSYMFQGCSSLNNIVGLRNWDISTVYYMEYVFKDCTSLTNLNALSNWNTEEIYTMYSAFENCTSLIDISGLSNWNVENNYDFDRMFKGCTNLSNASVLNGWTLNEENVTMTDMFLNTAVTVYPTWYDV